jgi:predicted kinase
MAAVHLICGFIGAGKTTYFKKLEVQTDAIRCSPDAWVVALYGNNPPRAECAEFFKK